jgi:hypothetical protein
MEYLGRVAGVAMLALSARALRLPCPATAAGSGGCARRDAAARTTPGGRFAPYQTPASAYPQYGSTAPVAAAPSYAGTTTVVAPYAPPAPRVENPPPPSPLMVWEPGHWSWSGAQFVWTPGHYAERPSASATWCPGYWQQGPAGWVWIEGSWS